jgi:hypothetical protein
VNEGGGGVISNLRPGELDVLRRPVEGHGGMQSFLRALLPRIQPDGSLALSADEVERVRKYAEDYGEGGFQERYRIILTGTKPRPPTLEDRW